MGRACSVGCVSETDVWEFVGSVFVGGRVDAVAAARDAGIGLEALKSGRGRVSQVRSSLPFVVSDLLSGVSRSISFQLSLRKPASVCEHVDVVRVAVQESFVSATHAVLQGVGSSLPAPFLSILENLSAKPLRDEVVSRTWVRSTCLCFGYFG